MREETQSGTSKEGATKSRHPFDLLRERLNWLRYPKGVVKRVRAMLFSFLISELLDDSEKQQIIPKLRRFEIQLGVLDKWEYLLGIFLIVLPIMMVFIAGFLLIPFLLEQELQDSGFTGDVFQFIAFYLIASAFTVIQLAGIFDNNSSLRTDFVKTFALVLVLLFVARYLSEQLDGDRIWDYLLATLISMLVLVSFVAILMLTANILVNLNSMFFERFSILRQPNAVISDRLLRSFLILERLLRDMDSLDRRKKLMRHLEVASRSLEEGIPRQLRSSDPETDLWLEHDMSKVASTLRNY